MKPFVLVFSGAEEEIRTPTAVTPLPPQGSASTSFATSAVFVWVCCVATSPFILRLANVKAYSKNAKKNSLRCKVLSS